MQQGTSCDCYVAAHLVRAILSTCSLCLGASQDVEAVDVDHHSRLSQVGPGDLQRHGKPSTLQAFRGQDEVVTHQMEEIPICFAYECTLRRLVQHSKVPDAVLDMHRDEDRDARSRL